MRAVTLTRVAETKVVVSEMCVQAEEELDVAHGVREGAEHVAEEKVSELDWIEAGEEESPIGCQEPLTRPWIQDW
jgi:hypothetical protein